MTIMEYRSNILEYRFNKMTFFLTIFILLMKKEGNFLV